ncbi:hypothetical protein CBR_g3631 [Chara braunii]|uniref:Uncharacterized protein n=1 Tax=Chara braunii TaxID=69332 RepID=A0A388KFV0_CHABU|nr:hypothetical protein CBR_g3631 [Chara braunii]|eukprot:GBG68932.1 hypothetical protein CBR_g3631 [Chara braunii]
MALRRYRQLFGSSIDAPPAIGIDLGTTNCCVGVWRHGYVEIIPNDQGQRTTPSYVAFTEDSVLIGNSAKNVAAKNSANTIYHAKRLIGQRFDDPLVQRDIATWPFRVARGSDGGPRILVQCDGGHVQRLEPQTISSMVLRKMKEIAEAYLDTEVRDAVITVPANFNQLQKLATREAAQSAGLKVLRLITEPSAAALTYALGRTGGFRSRDPDDPFSSSSPSSSSLSLSHPSLFSPSGRSATSPPPPGSRSDRSTRGSRHANSAATSSDDLTVLVVDWGGGTFDVSIMSLKRKEFKVIAVAGDTHLGGEDLDEKMARHFAREFSREHGIDLLGDDRAMRRLRATCQELKHLLSFATSASAEIDCLSGGIDYRASMTRGCFEDLNADLFASCMRLIEKAVAEAQMDKDKISKVVLAGGSTRIPKLQRMLKEFFGGKEPLKSVHPDEAIAHGAAIQAAVLTRGIGLEVLESAAAVIEAIPVSLGYKTASHRFHKMIARNATYPAEVVVMTQTTYPGDRSVILPVYEGERENAVENRCLGKVVLEGLKPGPPGSETESVPLKISFRIDEDGILTTSIVDKITGRRVSKTFGMGWGRFSREEAEHLAQEAREFQEEDQEHVTRARARHDLKTYLRAMKARVAMATPSEEKREAERALEEEEARLGAKDRLLSVQDYASRHCRLGMVCAPVIESLPNDDIDKQSRRKGKEDHVT